VVRRGLVSAGISAALVFGFLTVPGVAAPSRDIREVEAQVLDLEMRASAATERFNEAQIKLNETQARLDSVASRVQRERDDLSTARASMNDLARGVYMTGGLDTSLQVLLAEDPEDFLAQSAALDQVAESQAASMRRTQTASLRLAQSEAELQDKEQQAQGYRDEMADAKAEAEDSLAAAEEVLANLQEEERQRLAELQAQREREAREAAEAARRALEQQQAQQQQPAQDQSTGQDSDTGQDTGGADDTGGGGGGGEAEGPAASGGGFTGGSRAAAAISYALSQVGDRYVAAAAGPDAFDCSGLTLAAWRQAGVSLPHYSYAQFSSVRRIPDSELQPGDLVFYFGSGAHHVGMYIGNGKMVHAANPRDGVEITDYKGPWYGERYSGAGRVVG
jgi:cell wall-associated NlpC family hydrolase